MAEQLDDLENEAVEARQELVEHRLKYPNVCSNIFMKTLKCDIKTSMTFKVDTGDDNLITTKYSNEENLNKLGLKRNHKLSYEKLEDLEKQFTQVSKALDIISKNKTIANSPG